MNNDSIRSFQTPIISSDKTIAVSTIGYLCLAATWWMVGMLMTGWFTPNTSPGIATGTIYAVGSALLVIIGILSLIFGQRTLDSIIFLSSAGLFFSLQNAQMGSLAEGSNAAFTGYFAWYALIWAVFFCYLWISTFRHRNGTVRMLFLLLLWLGALAAAISGWGSIHGFEVLSGYLLLVTAILALIVSAIGILKNPPELTEETEKEVIPPKP